MLGVDTLFPSNQLFFFLILSSLFEHSVLYVILFLKLLYPHLIFSISFDLLIFKYGLTKKEFNLKILNYIKMFARNL